MIIVDTNVVVSGLLTDDREAPTARIVDAIIGGRVRCLLSPALLDELRNALLRPAIARQHGLGAADVDELLAAITQHAAWREPVPVRSPAPDPGYDHLWALLATEPGAELVTGDQQLLDNPISDSRFVSPAACVAGWTGEYRARADAERIQQRGN